MRGIISYISDKTSQIINTATGSVTGVITNQLMNAANLVNGKVFYLIYIIACYFKF